MRPTRFLRVRALAGVLPVLGACSGSTTPEEPLAATYVLARVGGAPPPLVIADHTTPGGVRQLYTMEYDSLSFESPTLARRALRAKVESSDPMGSLIPVVASGYQYYGTVLRRGERVIVEYENLYGSAVKPDTFTLRQANLVKMGPFGVDCANCAPVRRVEYVYEPR